MSTNVLPFRVAFVVDSEYLAAWQYWMLERLLAIPPVSLVAVIFQQAAPLTWRERVLRALFMMVCHFDSWLFRCPLRARALRSCLPLLGDVTLCDAGSVRYMQLLATQPVDLVIDFTREKPSSEMVAWAKQGVWRYFYNAAGCPAPFVMGLHEYAHRQDEMLAGVECFVAGETKARCLFQANSGVDHISLSRSLERALWKMADFIPQRVQALMQHGEGVLQPLTRHEAAFAVTGLTGLGMLRRYPALLLRKLYTVLFRQEQWVLLLGKRDCVRDGQLAVSQLRKIMPPRDRFWADPFLVQHAGAEYLFFEELVYAQGIGHLSCVRLYADGRYDAPVTVLERPYHLSYPFIFQWQGEYYLLPETAANRCIELYRCVEFPHRWVFVQTLMQDVEAYDATLCEYDGRWWLFVSLRHHAACSPNEALYLFYADSPLSTDWKAHPQNPVVASATHARPSGAIFAEKGQWYRPSQHCAGWYGRGLNINRIKRLDTQCYQEECISQVVPDGAFDMQGIHTLGLSETTVVADALHIHRRFGNLERYLMRLGYA